MVDFHLYIKFFFNKVVRVNWKTLQHEFTIIFDV
jgi:hypothetical protein